jgi:hypothetical protein
MTRLRPAAFVLFLVAVAACGSSTPLADGAVSPEALARAVLEAVRTNDRARLAALAVGEREFREHVWPRLPASRPERNLPFSFVWGDLRQKSDTTLTGTIQRYRGRLFELLKVSFSGVTDYVDYQVHRDATFRVRDSTGNESDLRVCGSFLEQDGIWKVFSYVVDD